MRKQPAGPRTWDGAPGKRTWDIWTHSYLVLGLLEVQAPVPRRPALPGSRQRHWQAVLAHLHAGRHQHHHAGQPPWHVGHGAAGRGGGPVLGQWRAAAPGAGQADPAPGRPAPRAGVAAPGAGRHRCGRNRHRQGLPAVLEPGGPGQAAPRHRRSAVPAGGAQRLDQHTPLPPQPGRRPLGRRGATVRARCSTTTPCSARRAMWKPARCWPGYS